MLQGYRTLSPSSLVIIIGKYPGKSKWRPLFILLLNGQNMDMFDGFPEDTSLMTLTPELTTGLTASRPRLHPQFPFQITFSLWAPSVRQLFCHLSLPEPLQFSVWVPVTIPAMCLCCRRSFLSTVCVYHGSQNNALKSSQSLTRALIILTVKPRVPTGPQCRPGRFRVPIAPMETLCSPAPYLVASVWPLCH